MKMTRPVAGLAALLLSGGAIFGTAAMANAEDTPPVDETTTVVEETIITPEVVEELPAEPVFEAPAVQRFAPLSVNKVVICHKPGTPAEAETKEVPEAAVEGHLGHGDVLGACDYDFIVAGWQMASYPGPNQADFSEDQHLLQTSDVLEEKNLGALDSWIAEQECGIALQIDGYVYSISGVVDTATQSLLAGAVLHGPNNPTEHLWGGGWNEAYKTVYTGDCVEDPEVAKADYGYTPATCTTGQTVAIDNGNLTNAVWTEESLAKNGTVGPAEFDITATLTNGAVWAEGQTGTFHVVLLGPDTKLCQNVVCEVHTDLGTSTNLDANGWANFESKPGGTPTYVEGGLNLDNADGNSKVSWGHALGLGNLSDVGQTAIDYTHTSGNLPSGPGFNIFVDSDGNGTFESRLVGEPNVYGQDWWATPSSLFALGAPQTTGGFGSDRHGTINEWIALYGDLTVSPNFAFAYGTGGPSAGVFHGGTIGCADFAFDYENEVVPVPALFSAEPTPPTCGVDGAFDFSGEFPNVDVTVTPEFDGPGTYTITGDTHEGFEFSDGTTHKELEITVLGALLFQNENNEGNCFVEPKQDKVVDGTPLCGERTFLRTTTVFTLEPVTGEYDNGVSSDERVANSNFQLCEGLAFTGVNGNMGMFGLLGVLLLLVGALVVLIRSQHRHSAE